MSEVISPEEWEAWRGNPITHKVKNLIRGERQEWIEAFGHGNQLAAAEDAHELTVYVSKVAGYVNALDWMLELGKPEEKGKEE